MKSFFKNANLGKNSCLCYIQEACNGVGISGIGVRRQITTHGPRSTAICQLFKAGYDGASILLKNGQR